MFYYISGKLTVIDREVAVIEANGVGYKLFISLSTYSSLASQRGAEVTLFTYLSVREDAMELFGFPSEDELALFKSLISVSGIGPKGAMSILGTLTVNELLSAVAKGDAKRISASPGVGLKTAQKICIELKDKVKKLTGAVPEGDAPDAEPITGELTAVVDTLMVYGFRREEIEKALSGIDRTLPTEELLRQTLRALGSRQ